MKIISLIRTLNESEIIEQCCQAYQFCDEILIGDGGSTDDTVQKALKYPKVKVRVFDKKVPCANGIMRNPDGEHLNFLYDWGHEEGADWLISQDCDQRPNLFLKNDARKLLEETDLDFLMPVQIFLWCNDHYFPNLSNGGGEWMHGIWAHRARINMKAIDKMPHYEFTVDGVHSIDPIRDKTGRTIDPPYCYLHHGWRSTDKVNTMLDYYRNSGLIKNMSHPLLFGGPLSPLEDFMVE